MKRFSLTLFFSLMILVIIGGFLFVNSDFNYNEEVVVDENANNQINLDQFDLSSDFEVITVNNKYLSNQETQDQIILLGKNNQESDIPYWEEMMIAVKKGSENTLIKKKLKDFNGYEPEITFADFTGDKKKDILIKTASGGSGGIYFHRILTLENDNLNIIFDKKNNKGIKVVGYFADDFKAKLKFENINKNVVLDISVNKDKYIKENIYNKKGDMIEVDLVRPYSYPFSSLKPIDYNQDGTYELKGIQKIVGAYGADHISEVESILTYKENSWNISNVSYKTYLKK